MNFKKIDEKSFSVDGIIYEAPEPKDLTNWQTQQMGAMLTALFKECGNVGELLLNAALGTLTRGVSEDTLPDVLAGIQTITGSTKPGAWTKGAIQGIAEITGFLSKDNNLAKVGAILFLNKAGGETQLEDAQLEARTKLFLGIPTFALGGGLMSFFGLKRLSMNSFGLPSLTSPTPISQPSAPTELNATASIDS